MAAMGNTQTVALQLEKVRDKLPLLYERDNILNNMIQTRGDVERVSTRAMRLPLQIRPGGKAGQATMDGDDLGRGSGTKYDVATITPVFFKFAIEITKLVEYATNASEKAIENAAKREVKNGMAQFKTFLDSMTQTSGNGVLANITGIAGSVLTLGTPYFAALLYANQDIQIYDATLATNRGTRTIDTIDLEAGTITLTAAPPGGTVATDLIVVDGVSGASPVSLLGLKYHHSNSTAGTWLGITRATNPEVITPRVNAGNASLSTGHVRLAMNKVRKLLGINALSENKVIAYMNVEQEHAWENLGITISEIIRQGTNQTQPDMLFAKSGTMGGAPIKSSIHADPTRIDFVALQHFGRAVIQDVDYYEVGGQTVFPVYGASGGLATAFLFYFIVGYNIWTENPRAGVYIDALSKPAGYL